MAPDADIVYGAHDDLQTKHFSSLGVIGTLGTADVAGSARTLSIAVNPVNGAQYSQILDATTGLSPSVEQRTQTPSGPALNVQIGPGDPISNIPVFMDFEHHQVHEGETFKAEYYDNGLDTNTVKFSFVCGSFSDPIRAPHLLTYVDIFNGAAIVQLYEGGTVAGGTALTVYNRNRASTATPASSVKVGITSTNGTLLDSFFVAPGRGVAEIGRPSSEWVLKSQGTYRIDVTGLSLNTDSITSFNWYEDQGV